MACTRFSLGDLSACPSWLQWRSHYWAHDGAQMTPSWGVAITGSLSREAQALHLQWALPGRCSTRQWGPRMAGTGSKEAVCVPACLCPREGLSKWDLGLEINLHAEQRTTKIHEAGKKQGQKLFSGMEWDGALRLVGIWLQILTWEEHREAETQNRIQLEEAAGALGEICPWTC